MHGRYDKLASYINTEYRDESLSFFVSANHMNMYNAIRIVFPLCCNSLVPPSKEVSA